MKGHSFGCLFLTHSCKYCGLVRSVMCGPTVHPRHAKTVCPGALGLAEWPRQFSFLVYTISKNAIEVLWWLRTPQLVAGLTIPRVVCGAQGPLKINMRRQGELTGSYSLRVLVVSGGIAERGGACGCGKRKWPLRSPRWASNPRTAERALLFSLYPKELVAYPLVS